MELWHKGNLEDPKVLDQEGALKEYLEILLEVCSAETSADPDNWTPENPLHGHCAVVALLVQKEFGGKLLRASLDGVAGYEQMRSHYWNELLNGSEVDLTAKQFRGNDRDLVPPGSNLKDGRMITPESLLENPLTKNRYELLRNRIDKRWDEKYGVKE